MKPYRRFRSVESNAHKRMIIYVTAAALMSLGILWLVGVNWQTSSNLHTVIEAMATLLAMMIGVMSLVRYYAKRDTIFLLVGTGFLGTAFLDGYHCVVTSEAFQAMMPSELPALVPWSWFASRMFLSLFMMLSWVMWMREKRLGAAGRYQAKMIYLVVALSTLASFGFFAFAPVPHMLFRVEHLHRPQELLPAVFFAIALAGYLHKGLWREDHFEHWLVMSLIVSLVAQVAYIPFSGTLFDARFVAAHLLKVVSYLCVVTGLLINMYSIFRRAADRSHDLERARKKIDQVHQRLMTSVNSMRNGLAIWDAEDRLVLANQAYLKFHEPISEIIFEGLRVEEFLNAGYDAGVWVHKGGDRDDWISNLLLERRHKKETELELVLADGRELIYAQNALDNGEVITTVVDVSSHRQREFELQFTKDQLEHIAYFDNLTGLANRTRCQKVMAEKFAFADEGQKFAIIQIDLDKFKRINDTLGHAAGDFLLRRIGERFKLMMKEFPKIDIYRWGGDEFIALIERDDHTDLNMICQELTDLSGIPLEYENKVLRPTVSLGVARFPEDGEDIEALMIFADLALYKTKELGRDGYQFYSSDMKAAVDSEARIERDLHEAIRHNQFELYFQPKINIRDESVTGLEALLRWNHPERGVVGPTDFLPVAETVGLAPAIGRKVFDHAAQSIQYWLQERVEFGRLAINLSPNHLKEGQLLDDLLSTMDYYDIEPQYLAVEVLESFLLDDPNSNIQDILSHLRKRGIQVELDDFGTGYASLSHLSTMPINGLKIDRSFIKMVGRDERQQGIVSSLMSLSKLMDLHVVCEGIETKEQVEAISRIGNCSLQGYFFAKPMPFKNVTRWLKEEQNLGLIKNLPEITQKKSA